MEDMLRKTENITDAADNGADSLFSQITTLKELLKEHKGQDVSVLDLRGICNWTDFFVIATVSSKIHMDGLERHIKDYCHKNQIELVGNSRKSTDDEWRLIDLGFVIIHLMNSRTREFYELERLWHPVTGVQQPVLIQPLTH
jgi:ribosome-associated protein